MGKQRRDQKGEKIQRKLLRKMETLALLKYKYNVIELNGINKQKHEFLFLTYSEDKAA